MLYIKHKKILGVWLSSQTLIYKVEISFSLQGSKNQPKHQNAELITYITANLIPSFII